MVLIMLYKIYGTGEGGNKDMPEIAIELTYEKILEAASKLSEEDKERLFFSLNKNYAKALDEMGKEAWESHQRGESIRLKDL